MPIVLFFLFSQRHSIPKVLSMFDVDFYQTVENYKECNVVQLKNVYFVKHRAFGLFYKIVN